MFAVGRLMSHAFTLYSLHTGDEIKICDTRRENC